MRLLLSIPLTLLFVIAFTAFFVLDSVAGYSTDADAIVETAHAAGIRGTLVDVTEEFILGELAEDPALADVSRSELHAIIDGVITEPWFDDSVRTAHAAAMAAVDDARTSAVIDLRSTKRALHDAMAELERRAGETCTRLVGADACADADQAASALAAYRGHGDRAIDRIADEVDLVTALTGRERGDPDRESAELQKIRERLGDARTMRWIGLSVLICCLALLALVNASPLSRMLRALGLALVLGAALYLVTVSATAGTLRDLAGEQLAAAGDRHAELDRYERMIAGGTERFAVELVGRSTSHSTGPVILIGVVGLFALVGGWLGRRR